jgi:two-component system OmpR family response regulator
MNSQPPPSERRRPIRVLVVDDDEAIRALTAAEISAPEFETLTAEDGDAMYRTLSTEDVDVIVLDINLPGADGLSLCRDLRSRRNTPIVLLTARASAVDRIIGLEMGADDYVPKPFDTRELAARIRNIIRRANGSASAKWVKEAHFEGWTLHLTRRHLIDPTGCMVMMSSAEFHALELLVKNHHTALPRDVLAEAEGQKIDVAGRGIDNLISRLRTKLAHKTNPSSELIKAVRGVGYVFTGDVTFS